MSLNPESILYPEILTSYIEPPEQAFDTAAFYQQAFEILGQPLADFKDMPDDIGYDKVADNYEAMVYLLLNLRDEHRASMDIKDPALRVKVKQQTVGRLSEGLVLALQTRAFLNGSDRYLIPAPEEEYDHAGRYATDFIVRSRTGKDAPDIWLQIKTHLTANNIAGYDLSRVAVVGVMNTIVPNKKAYTLISALGRELDATSLPNDDDLIATATRRQDDAITLSLDYMMRQQRIAS